MRLLVAGFWCLLAATLSAQTLPEGWSGTLALTTGSGTWALDLRPQSGELPLVSVESRPLGGAWTWKADNRSPSGTFQDRVEFSGGDEHRMVITKPLLAPLVFTLRPLGFSGLTGTLKKTLSQGLSQSTPLKLRVSSAPPWSFTVHAVAVDRDGKVWAALLADHAVRLWSPDRKATLGLPLDRSGEPISGVAVAFDAQNRPLVVLEGPGDTKPRVYSWTGKAWAREPVPESAGGAPFGLSADARLQGWIASGDGWQLVETSWQSPGFGRPVPTAFRAPATAARAILGALALSPPNAVITYPGVWGTGVVVGTFGKDFAVWNPAEELPWGFWNAQTGWRMAESPAGLKVASFSAGGSLLHVWDNSTAPRLWQFDGQEWRIPLPLDSLAPGDARAWSGYFLPPQPKARSGLLVLARGGAEIAEADRRLDVWELP